MVKDVVVGTRPRRFAATPDGKDLWVTAELSGDVYIVDRAKFTVAGKVEFLPPGMRKTDVTPVGIVMTRDGKTAYVTLGHAAHVAVVDVPGRKVLGYILVGKRAWGVTLSRDEFRLFVANGLGDDITVIDTRAARRSSPSRSVAYPGASRSMTGCATSVVPGATLAQRRLRSSRRVGRPPPSRKRPRRHPPRRRRGSPSATSTSRAIPATSRSAATSG